MKKNAGGHIESVTHPTRCIPFIPVDMFFVFRLSSHFPFAFFILNLNLYLMVGPSTARLPVPMVSVPFSVVGLPDGPV